MSADFIVSEDAVDAAMKSANGKTQNRVTMRHALEAATPFIFSANWDVPQIRGMARREPAKPKRKKPAPR